MKLGHYAPGYHGNNKTKWSLSVSQVLYGWPHWLMHSDNPHSVLLFSWRFMNLLRTWIFQKSVLYLVALLLLFPFIGYNSCTLGRSICPLKDKQCRLLVHLHQYIISLFWAEVLFAVPNAHKDWYNFESTDHTKQGINPEFNTINLIYFYLSQDM